MSKQSGAAQLYKKPDSKKVSVNLKIGDKITFLGSDNKEWILVKVANGKTGWFAVDDSNKIKGTRFSAWDVFSELSEGN